MGVFVILGRIFVTHGPILLLCLFDALDVVQEHQIEVAAVQLADIGKLADRERLPAHFVNQFKLLCR